MNRNDLLTLFVKGLLLFFVATSCNSSELAQQKSRNNNQNTGKLMGQFYARHLQQEGTSRGEATFKVQQDSSLSPEIFLPKGVIFIDGYMEERNLEALNKKRYQANRRRSFDGTFLFTFFWPDHEKKAFEATLSPVDDIIFSNPYTVGKSAQLTWDGQPLGKDEFLVLLITDSAGKVATIEIKGPTISSEIQIPEDKLKDIAKGEATMEIVRKKNILTKKPEWEARAEVEYYAAPIGFQVK